MTKIAAKSWLAKTAFRHTRFYDGIFTKLITVFMLDYSVKGGDFV
jgi:hypothetical protein